MWSVKCLNILILPKIKATRAWLRLHAKPTNVLRTNSNAHWMIIQTISVAGRQRAKRICKCMCVCVHWLVGRSVGRMVRLVCVFDVTCAPCHLNGIAQTHTRRHRKRFIKLRQRKLYMCSVKVSSHETERTAAKRPGHATYVWHMENQICPFNTLWRLVHVIFSLCHSIWYTIHHTHTHTHISFFVPIAGTPTTCRFTSILLFACSLKFFARLLPMYRFAVRRKLYFSRTKSICNVVQNKWWNG